MVLLERKLIGNNEILHDMYELAGELNRVIILFRKLVQAWLGHKHLEINDGNTKEVKWEG